MAALRELAGDPEAPSWLRWAAQRMVALDTTIPELAPQVGMTDKGLRRILHRNNVPHRVMIGRLEAVLGDMPAPEKASLAEARAKLTGHPARWVESTCRNCPKVIRRRTTDSNRVYCSRRCHANHERTMPRPQEELGKFVTAKWLASGQDIPTYANDIGIGRLVLRKLMHDDRIPADATYQKLRAYFGDELPAVITDDVLRAERARMMSVIYRGTMHTPEAIRKSAATRIGQKHSAERVAKALATRIRTGGYQRFFERGREYARSERGRAERSIFMQLRHTKNPDQATLAAWAVDAGKKLECAPEVVRAHWTVYMARKGLLSGSAADQQHQQICACQNEIPRPAWKVIAEQFSFTNAESCRVAHAQWHTGNPSVPSCGPANKP